MCTVDSIVYRKQNNHNINVYVNACALYTRLRGGMGSRIYTVKSFD